MAVQNSNNTDNAAKERALQQALDQIQKQYGKGAIMKLGESGPVSNIEISFDALKSMAPGILGKLFR